MPRRRARKSLLHSLARLGAVHRLAQLREEINQIHFQFPDLRAPHRAKGYAQPLDETAALGESDAPGKTATRPRRRRTMSAAQRKAVSARMKKYWAQRRKAKRA
jgi:hypothetical protein